MRTLAAAVSICLLLGVQSVASAASGDELYARPGQLVTAHGNPAEFLLHGKRLAHRCVRFGLGGLGTRMDDRAAGGREVDTRLQLRSRRRRLQ
jgi:hypothetical protein